MANASPLPSSIPLFGTLAFWAQSTFYSVGQRVLNAPNIYQCTTAGTSANVDPGPAGSGGAITDGTVVWAFQYAASPAWVTLTAYTVGQRVVKGGNTYQCVFAGTSGATGPTGTTGIIGDGSVNWIYCYGAIADVVTPTAQTGDMGGVQGATLRAGYLNWVLSGITPWLYYLRTFIGATQTWTGVQTWTLRQIFQLGATIGDSIQSFNAAPAVTDWSLFLDGNFSSFGHTRLYYSQGRAILTLNALYTAGSPGLWSQDNNLKYSLALELDGGNHVIGLLEQDPAMPNWVDASWVRLAIFNTIGAVLVSALETGGAITADSGDITARSGNIIASAGKSSVAATRSSATKGVGQAVVAGEVWKDTAVFAWFVATVSGAALTFVRGANIANVVRDAPGQFTITTQTAATNVLVPVISIGSTPAAFPYVDFNAGSPTTTVVHFAVYEPSIAGFVDPASIYCVILQG